MEESELSREVNRRIHAITERWGESGEFDYVCECDAYECRAWVRVSRVEAERVFHEPAMFLLTEAHHRRDAETVRSGPGYVVVRVVQAGC